MARQSLEELRERLLRQHRVQQMIQVRAYEIFQMRGAQPGGEAHDWFHAEGEVLAFLIAHESVQEDEPAEGETAGPASDPEPRESPVTRKPKARGEAKPSSLKQATTKKSATRRDKPTKPAGSKSKSKRNTKQSKADESAQ